MGRRTLVALACGVLLGVGTAPPGAAASGVLRAVGAVVRGPAVRTPIPGGQPPPASVAATQVATLRAQQAAPPSRLSALFFLNSEDGWVGAGGKVGATADGGTTWTWAPVPTGLVTSLRFVSPADGWLAGETPGCVAQLRAGAGCRTVILHTSDGGRIWRRQYAGPCGALCSGAQVQFADARHGWALVNCADEGSAGEPCRQLLATSDGGAAWRPLPLPRKFVPTGMALGRAGTGWVAGVNCRAGPAGIGLCPALVWHTADGGRRWQRELLPGSPAGGPVLSFANLRDGWLVPSSAPACTMGGCWLPLYATDNGGATWVRLPSRYRRTGFQGQPDFISASDGFVPVGCGAGIGLGAVARTTDGGRTWASAGDARGWCVAAVSAVNARDVWAIGGQKIPPGGAAGAFLVRSTDGGVTWTQQLPAIRPITAVDFLSANEGFGLGTNSDPGAVLATWDGGARWEQVAGMRATGAQLLHIAFANLRDGWVSGSEVTRCCGVTGPVLLATRDGGRTWRRLSGPPGTITALYRATAGGGVVATSRGLFATTDGGIAWRRVGRVPTGAQLMDLSLDGLRHAWALDFAAIGGKPRFTLWTTGDLGRSWAPVVSLPFGPDGQAAAYGTGPGAVWLVRPAGAGTVLLRTLDGGRTWTRLVLRGYRAGVADIAFLNSADGWLVGGDGLWRTEDGGCAWVQLA